MSTPIEVVVNRLEKVRSIGNGRYIACCPAHDDKSPSLSISEGDDGRVLVKCWSGCDIEEIVMSLGLKMNDLFQQNSLNLTEKRNYHYRKGVEEVENALCHELIVLLQILQTRISDRQNWKDSRYRAQRPEFLPMPNNPWGREILAVERILRGLELRYGG